MQFLTNYSEITFLEKIRTCLRTCSSFCFSVSFIKKAGLILVYKDIQAAVARGVVGRIITSTYQNFTDIESLKAFLTLQMQYDNFTCHLDHECFRDEGYSTLGYHSKGYIFYYDDNRCEVIIGSSNLTRYALLKNIEWDISYLGNADSPEIAAVQKEFDDKWEKTHPLNSEIVALYSTKLNFAVERWDMDYDLSRANVKPNFMQRRALKELNRYRAIGIGKTLVVAAAGSGKTYLAAFDALNFDPKRLLYIVHEGSILQRSLETFQDVFGPSVTYGIFSGTSKETDAQFVFATNFTMSRSLELFDQEEFDYIIIDECHHATASTYKRIIEYFKPEFLLGLTATPERMDNQDVFEMFDKNVPFELRLRDAIINDLVVPFHYYGIRDTLVDYGLTKSEERRMVAQLATVEHCAFIVDSIEKHRPEGKLKALAFCRNITHARMMCEAMSENYHTAYLTGRNDTGERMRAYSDLQSDSKELEILFCVDILNEGVDIPGINMVLFLRPTESSTIFIQQLGRGLRKCDNKPFVTVLDFIGNSYKRSTQIALALGSIAENFVLEKRLMRSLIKDDFSALGLTKYGVEIHIDELSKEEMMDSIENENFNSLNYMKQDYFNFKKYINTEFYPKHMDFFNNDCAPDFMKFLSIKIRGRKTVSYYNFLKGIDETDLPDFTDHQIMFIDYLSKMLPLVRAHEFVITQRLLKGACTGSGLNELIANEKELDHALKYMLESGFVTQSGDTYALDVEKDDQFIEYVNDLIDYGLSRYKAEYDDEHMFTLYSNYRKDQVRIKLCRNPNDIMKGTYLEDGSVYIFASIKKDASVEEHLNYKDKFLTSDVFQWECESNLNDENKSKLINSKKAYLFIRKVETENGITLPFTYVGEGIMTDPRPTGSSGNTLLFDIKMDDSLPDYLQYDFGIG